MLLLLEVGGCGWLLSSLSALSLPLTSVTGFSNLPLSDTVLSPSASELSSSVKLKLFHLSEFFIFVLY